MAVIYKATNQINGKSYIGYDSNWPNRRQHHIANARRTKVIYAFHRALHKHGADNFIWEVLQEDATYDDEIRLIEEHQTYYLTGKGYNLTKGGEGGLLGRIRPEHAARMKGNTLRKGISTPHTEETKKKISLAKTGKPNPSLAGEKNHFYQNPTYGFLGKKHSEETKEKLRQLRKGKVPWNKGLTKDDPRVKLNIENRVKTVRKKKNG